MLAWYLKNGEMTSSLIYLRWPIFSPLFLLYSVFLNIFSRFCRKRKWYRKLNQRLLKIWANLIIWALNIKIEINPVDLQKLDNPESRIIICNHRSHIDSIILWSVMPKSAHLSFAAKLELFQIPLFGRLLESSESVIIERGNPKIALNTLMDAFKIDFTRTLVAYAEGTRNRTDTPLLPFKRGIFMLAKDANVPILPIIIQGAEIIMPPGKAIPKINQTVKVKVLNRFDGEIIQNQDSSHTKNQVWNDMKAEIGNN